MYTRGIRGAITVSENTKEEIKNATIELVSKLLKENEIEKENISHVIFSMTHDLDADFPAKYARLELGFDEVPMICSNEVDIEGALPLCIRVLLVVNTYKLQRELKHIYLKEAARLRPDLIRVQK